MPSSIRYSIADIAEKLGVSTSTISRAINGKKGVGEKKKQEILDYIERIGYQPNRLAQGLSKGYIKIVALLLGDIRNPFYTDLVFNIQKTLTENGYMVMVFNSEYDVEREIELLDMIKQFNFAGLILITAQDDRIAKTINKLNMPMVLVNRIINAYTGDSVLIDNFQAGYMAVIHLLDLGHKRIGFVKGPGVSSASSQRFEGFKKAMDNYNVAVDEQFIFQSDLTVQSGKEIARQFFSIKENRSSAMVIVNDLTSIGFMDICQKQGLRIPEQLSIVSFDDIWCASVEGINLTTVTQHVEKMSGEAARLILKQLNGSEEHPERVIIPPTLIVRNSTAKCP